MSIQKDKYELLSQRAFVGELAEFELILIRQMVDEPTWLRPPDESTLRWALSLARVSEIVVTEGAKQNTVDIGHATDMFRQKLYQLLVPCFDKQKHVQRDVVPKQIEKIFDLLKTERASLLELYGQRLPSEALDQAVRKRPLSLALGGGGGAGYIFLGAMLELEDAGLRPDVIVGTSMGAILGAFRAMNAVFEVEAMRKLIASLSWSRVFRLFERKSRFGVPATLSLYLREVIGHEFESEAGFKTLADMDIPLRVIVAGLKNADGAVEPDFEKYAFLLDETANNPLFLRKRSGSILKTVVDFSRKPIKRITLGLTKETADFDVLDAIGFSASVPGMIHYDIERRDPRMVRMIEELMQREGVSRLFDGGFADNLPALGAWYAAQDGTINQRDPMVLALDCFAPQLSRHLIFLPLMRLAAETSKEGRNIADLTIAYRKVLSPLHVVPKANAFLRVVENGRKETKPQIPFIRKMIGPIPDPPNLLIG